MSFLTRKNKRPRIIRMFLKNEIKNRRRVLQDIRTYFEASIIKTGTPVRNKIEQNKTEDLETGTCIYCTSIYDRKDMISK